jgi:hypothetical protein
MRPLRPSEASRAFHAERLDLVGQLSLDLAWDISEKDGQNGAILAELLPILTTSTNDDCKSACERLGHDGKLWIDSAYLVFRPRTVSETARVHETLRQLPDLVAHARIPEHATVQIRVIQYDNSGWLYIKGPDDLNLKTRKSLEGIYKAAKGRIQLMHDVSEENWTYTYKLGPRVEHGALESSECDHDQEELAIEWSREETFSESGE